MIVIGDIHGCVKTLEALLNKLPDDKVCCVGDYIDRGPSSKEVVDLLMKSDIDCVMGNHEDMLLNAIQVLRAEEKLHCDDYQIWIQNGGNKTLESYDVLFPIDIEFNHIKWVARLPKYRIYDDIVDKKGRKLFISHAGISSCTITQPSIERAVKNSDILWHRDKLFVPKGTFSVVGHTPVASHCVYYDTSDWINIDTGCVYYRKRKYGVLTAFQYPEMKIFQQENID